MSADPNDIVKRVSPWTQRLVRIVFTSFGLIET